MARDADALNIAKWAESPAAIVSTPESLGLVRSIGFPESYGIDRAWTHGLFNQFLRELTALFVGSAQHGILFWDLNQYYPHPSIVMGSDGELYFSVQASGGSLISRDPVVDTQNFYWSRFELVEPVSSTTARGTIEIATVAESRAGMDDERAVTPQGALAYINQAIAAAPRPLWL